MILLKVCDEDLIDLKKVYFFRFYKPENTLYIYTESGKYDYRNIEMSKEAQKIFDALTKNKISFITVSDSQDVVFATKNGFILFGELHDSPKDYTMILDCKGNSRVKFEKNCKYEEHFFEEEESIVIDKNNDEEILEIKKDIEFIKTELLSKNKKLLDLLQKSLFSDKKEEILLDQEVKNIVEKETKAQENDPWKALGL